VKFIPFFLICCISTFAQKSSKDTLVRYFDARLEPCKKKEFVFIGVIIRDPLGWNGIIYDDSARVIMRGKYASQDCTIKNGWFLYYHPNGKNSVGGKFENNIRQGLWMRWYPSGKLSDSILFVNGQINGPSFSFYENGSPESSGNYLNGYPDKDWTYFHANGTMSTREKYKDGKLADIECFDTTGKSTGISCAVFRNPEIIGRYGGIMKFMQDSIALPIDVSNVKLGVVQVEFTVSKDGTMYDLKILSSPDPILSNEVIRVVKSVPGWYPAISHNRSVDYTFTMNIPFSELQVTVTGSWYEPRWWDYPVDY